MRTALPMIVVALAFVAAGALVGCGSGEPRPWEPPAGVAPQLLAGRIAFSSARNPRGVYTMLPDGSGKTHVPNTQSGDEFPSWNPDGTRLCFRGSAGICTIRADGVGRRKLHDESGAEWCPRWRPTGGRIAFSQYDGAEATICVMRVDGSEVTPLTPSGTGYNSDLCWSPDGQKIAFASSRDGGQGIYTMNADGTGVHRISPPGVSDCRPAWSPNGTRIAFSRGPVGNSEIWTMGAATGGSPKRLTYDGAWALDPAWSPDGSKIVFASTRNGEAKFEIWVVGAGGAGFRHLTSNLIWDAQPCWWAP